MSTDKSPHPHPIYAVARSAAVIGAATLCSRLLGFLRDVVIARLFGVYVYAQAFVIAFRIPNLFRDFVAEGATNAAFVPVFSEYAAKHTKEEFWELSNVVLNLLLVVLAAITLLGIIFAGTIVRMIAPGFAADPEKLLATIRLTRIIFPYLLLISLAAYCMGILNSLKDFTVSAFAPCLLNISVIIFALLFGEGIKGLALGVLVGGILQLAIQVPVIYKKGFRLRLFQKFDHPAARVIGKLMVPRVASSSIYQLNNFVDSIFGSLAWIVGEGGVAVLYFSYRLIQFPLGVFSNALSQAVLPEFSRQALEDNYGELKSTLSKALRLIFFVMLPASAAFMVLSRPLVSGLFGGGKFDAYSQGLTASALFFYSIGLCAYGATKVLQCCFFALKDTKTPMKISFIALVSNIILNAALMFPMKIGGIALATSISGINSALLLFFILRKRLGGLQGRELLVSFTRILAASICMGGICYFSRHLHLAIAVTLGALSYVGFSLIFRVREMQELYLWISKKK